MLAIKVIKAMRVPSIKGEPRAVSDVMRDRLVSSLVLCDSYRYVNVYMCECLYVCTFVCVHA